MGQPFPSFFVSGNRCIKHDLVHTFSIASHVLLELGLMYFYWDGQHTYHTHSVVVDQHTCFFVSNASAVSFIQPSSIGRSRSHFIRIFRSGISRLFLSYITVSPIVSEIYTSLPFLTFNYCITSAPLRPVTHCTFSHSLSVKNKLLLLVWSSGLQRSVEIEGPTQ